MKIFCFIIILASVRANAGTATPVTLKTFVDGEPTFTLRFRSGGFSSPDETFISVRNIHAAAGEGASKKFPDEMLDRPLPFQVHEQDINVVSSQMANEGSVKGVTEIEPDFLQMSYGCAGGESDSCFYGLASVTKFYLNFDSRTLNKTIHLQSESNYREVAEFQGQWFDAITLNGNEAVVSCGAKIQGENGTQFCMLPSRLSPLTGLQLQTEPHAGDCIENHTFGRIFHVENVNWGPKPDPNLLSGIWTRGNCNAKFRMRVL